MLFLAGKNVKVCDFGQKKPSDFGKDFFFFFFGDHLLLAGKNVKVCDFGQKKPSDFGEDLFFFFFLEIFTETSPQSNAGTIKIWNKFNAGFQLCSPDFNFAPPISRSWRRPWFCVFIFVYLRNLNCYTGVRRSGRKAQTLKNFF